MNQSLRSTTVSAFIALDKGWTPRPRQVSFVQSPVQLEGLQDPTEQRAFEKGWLVKTKFWPCVGAVRSAHTCHSWSSIVISYCLMDISGVEALA